MFISWIRMKQSPCNFYRLRTDIQSWRPDTHFWKMILKSIFFFWRGPFFFTHPVFYNVSDKQHALWMSDILNVVCMQWLFWNHYGSYVIKIPRSWVWFIPFNQFTPILKTSTSVQYVVFMLEIHQSAQFPLYMYQAHVESVIQPWHCDQSIRFGFRTCRHVLCLNFLWFGKTGEEQKIVIWSGGLWNEKTMA